MSVHLLVACFQIYEDNISTLIFFPYLTLKNIPHPHQNMSLSNTNILHQ